MTSTTKETIRAVRRAISTARMETNEAACQVVGDESPAALELYAWNAKVSGALMPPLHVCEVTVRNAVADVLEAIYGDLEQVRKLRNRIAHHEPIFMRDLTEDFQRIVGLVRMKCVVTTGWMLGHQHALALIQSRP